MDTKSENVHRLISGSKEIILIGTAHVSPKSVTEVKEVIETERPDTVCVELCESRYQSIIDVDKWKNTDIVKVIKNGQSLLLLINLILSSYQKRLAHQFDVQPGQEMLQGIASANEISANLCLADRDIKTTMLRLWRNVGFWEKIKLLFEVIFSLFNTEELTEEEMEKMKTQDMLTAALDELSHASPKFKSVLIDERDRYLAEKIKTAPGDKIVAVLGAGHVPGIKKELNLEHDLTQLSSVPPTSRILKIIAWAIPLLLIALIVSTFTVDRATGLEQLVTWVAWTGTLSALGALIALSHPLTILTAFIAAPLTTLHPLLASGWFAGITEAVIKKPNVQDFEDLSDDIFSFKGFWRNKITHILLVVVLVNFGSSMGVLLGGLNVFRSFFNTFF